MTWWQLRPEDKLPCFKSYNIGPALAFNFPNKHINRVRKLKIPKGERVMLIFGEVDCRWHIPHPFKHKRDPILQNWQDNLLSCARRYFEGIASLQKDYDVCVWGVHPPSRENLGPEYPMYGDCEYRTEVVRKWNRQCWEYCDKLGLKFYNIFWKLVKEDGMVDPKYLLDGCHMSQEAMPHALKVLGCE
jgi:hypothetical protein